VNSGWHMKDSGAAFLALRCAAYFIAAATLVAQPGRVSCSNGATYTTTAYWDDSTTDLRIWIWMECFPAYAPLYATNKRNWQSTHVIGRGTQRGEPVMLTTVQTVYTTNVVDLRRSGFLQRRRRRNFPEQPSVVNTMTYVTSELVTNTGAQGLAGRPR